ncbi:MAG: 16S rRNA pseudouridine(516) synthase [Gammaproteobacteria bacterium 28-57-27]|nr:MAG: 16S rRNA pseudouridine(516) synthase [Gammaproteobacteria bacterium 28-57-27]
MQLADILYSQGFGTRRSCAGLIETGAVEVLDASGIWHVAAADDSRVGDYPAEGLHFRVQGQEWVCRMKAYIMLHKPAGTECSQKPSAHPSIFSLLPSPLRLRPHKGGALGVQAVGRLDQDTTGLLLLSDDGSFIHRMSSPKKHVAKVYEVTTKHPLGEAQVQQLLAGVVLDDDPAPVKAAAAECVSTHHLRLTLTEGKYHQVKRMLAAVSNRVESLHRSQMGGLKLPEDLLPGQWRYLSEHELLQVQAR